MNTTLTIRTDEALKEALEERAEARGKTVSEVAREILSQALAERPHAGRVGHLRGELDLVPDQTDPWRREMESRNRRK